MLLPKEKIAEILVRSRFPWTGLILLFSCSPTYEHGNLADSNCGAASVNPSEQMRDHRNPSNSMFVSGKFERVVGAPSGLGNGAPRGDYSKDKEMFESPVNREDLDKILGSER